MTNPGIFQWMDSICLDSDCEYLDEIHGHNEFSWCVCNNTLPTLYRLLLHFSYLYKTCRECRMIRYKYENRYKYEDKYFENPELIDNQEISIQIKNIIKKNTKIIHAKFMNMTPVEFIIRLYKCVHVEDIDPFLKHRNHQKIRCSQHYLSEINKFINIQYKVYELEKSFAFIYIKHSNHIGNDAKQKQLPLEIWKYIFTFM